MMKTLYIGAKCVPSFYIGSGGSSEWVSGVPFEPLTVVTYNTTWFISKKPVPAGAAAPQAGEYWAQVPGYITELDADLIEWIQEHIGDLEDAVGDLDDLETTAKTNLVSAVNEVKGETTELKDDLISLNNSERNPEIILTTLSWNNKKISSVTGDWGSEDSRYVSTVDLIPVSGYTKIFIESTNPITPIGNFYYYGADKSFITSEYLDVTQKVLTDKRVTFFRWSGFNSGGINPETYDGKITLSTTFQKYAEDTDADLQGLQTQLDDIFVWGNNIFNKETAIPDKYVNCVNGNYQTANGYHATGFVGINAGDEYTVSNFDQLAFYNENKQFIGGLYIQNGSLSVTGSLTNVDSWAEYTDFQEPLTFTAQTGFSYINCTIFPGKLDTFMIWHGDDYPNSYVPYCRTIPYLVIDKKDVLGLQDDVPIDRVFADIIKNPKQIKLIGDSLTAGVGGTGYDNTAAGGGEQIYNTVYSNVSGHCWANSLIDYWEEKFNCTVKNYGWSGIASEQIITYWSYLVRAEDDIVVCMIGTNDREGSTTIADYITKLETIVQKAATDNKQLVLMASIPASVTNENQATVHFHMEDVEHALRYVTDKYNIPFLNLYELFLDYCKFTSTTIDSLLADGLHPNDNGYDVMFYLISNAFGIGTKRPDADW